VVNFQDDLLIVLDRAVQFKTKLSAVGSISGSLSVDLEHKGSGALLKTDRADELASVARVGLDVGGSVVGVRDSEHTGLGVSAQEGGHLGCSLAFGLGVSVVIVDAQVVHSGTVELEVVSGITLILNTIILLNFFMD